MAGTRICSGGPNNSLYYRIFSHLYANRVTILWVMTVVMGLGFVIRGYISQFCEQCELEDRERGAYGHSNEVVIHRRDDLLATPVTNVCLSINFAPEGSQRLVALPSYPGSGNTWLRHLMEHTTGVYTSSVYRDKKLISGGFLGEEEDYRKRTVLGVKMHRCSKRELQKFPSIIFLIRNPYNAMISEWHRFHTTHHTGTVPESTFRTKEWEEFVEEESSHWERMITNCHKDHAQILVIFYENLQERLALELTRIHRFLRIPIDAERLKCTLVNAEGNFHRNSKLDFEPFTDEMIVRINRRIDNAAMVLNNMGKTTFPVDYKKKAGTS